MRLKRCLMVTFALLITLCMISCSNYINSSDDFYGGDIIDAEMLSRLAESVFSENESLRPEETEAESGDGETESNSEEITTEVESQRVHDGIYYWTKSGQVYHKWSDCGHLKNAKEIFSGDARAAEAAGFVEDDLCSSCAKK